MDQFPFDLSDIKSWIVRKKDGTAIRYDMVRVEEFAKTNDRNKPVTGYGHTGYTQVQGPIWANSGSFRDWCNHTPVPSGDPIFEKDNIRIFIADAAGAKQVHALYDVAIDGGHVLPVPGEYDNPALYGDELLSGKLLKFATKFPLSKLTHEEGKVRILKVDWLDRHAPPLKPEFWPALLAQLKFLQAKKGAPLNVLTICQGGHGRSGSAMACLIMCLTDYTPLDVLTHIRALHCAKAIESKEQHEYLNEVGKLLGRDPDAMDAAEVKSFKDRFLTMTNPFALPYMDRVKGGKGAALAERTSRFL